MLKKDFLDALRQALSFLPEKDIDERIRFYGEMIEDRMDDGLNEMDAVAEIGSVEQVVADIIADTSLVKLVKKKMKPTRSIKAWEIALLVLGSPVWLPLLIAAFAVILSLYIALWAVIVSFWAVFVSCVASAFGIVVSGVIVAATQNMYSGAALVAAGCICAGLSIFLFYGCKAATKGVVLLTKMVIVALKNKCTGKEKV